MATKIGLVYGSSTGNTAGVAERLATAFRAARPDSVEVHELSAAGLGTLTSYDYLLVGCPTWNTGELQEDWKTAFDKLDGVDLSGRKIAIFGLGDTEYDETHNFGSQIIADMLKGRGAAQIGDRVIHDASGADMADDLAMEWADAVVELARTRVGEAA